MPKYLIEIPHSENSFECRQIVKLFVESGSHLLANALWGCRSGVHKAWFISDFDNKDDVMHIIPPFLRHTATIVELSTFSKEEILRFEDADKH